MSSTCLLVRLQGPLQSWGTTSRFDERDSQAEPSKSAVIGLLCAALGRDWEQPVDDLAACRFGVRVDREGVPLRDYQTVTGVANAAGQVGKDRTVVSPRMYLADAVFLVALEGQDASLLSSTWDALASPVWPLSLGRRACTPSRPVWLPDGVIDGCIEDVFAKYPLLVADGESRRRLRVVLEPANVGAVRLDQPIGAFAQRQFGPRHVTSGEIDVPESVVD